MALTNVSPGMLKAWTTKKTKANRLDSCWEQLSNRADGLPSIPNAKDAKVPKEALHYVKAEGGKNAYETTIPMIEGLKQDGKGGLQVAEGSGEKPSALYAKVYYNNARKVMNVSTEGVENDAVKYLQLAQESHSMLSDWMAEDKDFRCQMALLEGGDRYITEDRYWLDYSEMRTAPLAKSIHPNIAYPGMSAAIVRGATYAADMTSIVNALAALGPTSGFSLNALDGAIEFAYRFLKPLGMSSGNQAVKYVMLVSSMQALQLARDAAWIDLMRGAEKRGPDNRAISGIIGTRKGVLVIEDMRSPILNLGSSAFEYVTPIEAASRDGFYGYGKLGRSAKGAAGQATGTMEIARILGSGAIGCPTAGDIEFTDREGDFKYQKEICASVKNGYNRLDFKGKTPEGADITRNISSALYFTSTPAITY